MWKDKIADCGCKIYKAKDRLTIEFCGEHYMSGVEIAKIKAEYAALLARVAKLEAENETLNNALAMCDTQYFSEYWHDFLEYLEVKPPRSRSVGAGGSVYPFGGRETETR